MQSSTVAQQAPARNLNRGWWPMLPEWSRRVLKPVLSPRQLQPLGAALGQ